MRGVAICTRMLARLLAALGATGARVVASDGQQETIIAAAPLSAAASFSATERLPIETGDLTLSAALELQAAEPLTPERRALAAAAAEIVAPLLQVDALRYECDRERAASRELLQITEREIGRIILDIHDGPVQYLFAALSQLNLLQRQLTRQPSDVAAEQRLAAVIRLLETALDEIRMFMGTYRPPEFERRSLVALLEGLLIQHEEMTGIAAALRVDGTPPPIPLPAKIGLYRILQEALSNAARHGRATRTDVLLAAEPGRIRLEVTDDGCGFDPQEVFARGADPGFHLGLSGMQERVRLLGGTFDLESAPGEGTRIVVSLPIHGGS